MVKRGRTKRKGEKEMGIDIDIDIDTALIIVQRGKEISKSRHKNFQQ